MSSNNLIPSLSFLILHSDNFWFSNIALNFQCFFTQSVARAWLKNATSSSLPAALCNLTSSPLSLRWRHAGHRLIGYHLLRLLRFQSEPCAVCNACSLSSNNGSNAILTIDDECSFHVCFVVHQLFVITNMNCKDFWELTLQNCTSQITINVESSFWVWVRVLCACFALAFGCDYFCSELRVFCCCAYVPCSVRSGGFYCAVSRCMWSVTSTSLRGMGLRVLLSAAQVYHSYQRQTQKHFMKQHFEWKVGENKSNHIKYKTSTILKTD